MPVQNWKRLIKVPVFVRGPGVPVYELKTLYP